MKSRQQLVVGVDAGGSSTRAVAVAADGSVLGLGLAAAGNPTSSGPEFAAASVVAAVRGALRDAGAADPIRTAVAMAGGSIVGEEWLPTAFAGAGIPGPVSLEADLAAVYLSGSLADLGYALISGTGAIAARLRDHAIDAVADGVGWLLGDDGSGFWIGHRVVRAAAAELDGRGPTTTLTSAVLAGLGPASGAAPCLDRPDDLAHLLDDVYRERPVRLARFAPLAFAAADDGDPVARAIVDEAARLLATTLEAVLSEHADAPVVLGGSVLAGQPRMAEAVRAALRRRGIAGRVVTVPDGVVGAAVLALERAGVLVDEAVADRIRRTLAARRG